MNIRKLIGITGKMQNGKTTFAKGLKYFYEATTDCEVIILPFAQGLKDLMNTYFFIKKDGSIEHFLTKKALKYSFIRLFERLQDEELLPTEDILSPKKNYKIIQKYLEKYHNKNTSQNERVKLARKIYQQFGTNICRELNDDIWVDKVANRLERYYKEKDRDLIVIIDDVRFQNELDFILSYSEGYILNIDTEYPKHTPKHLSEELSYDIIMGLDDYYDEYGTYFINVRWERVKDKYLESYVIERTREIINYNNGLLLC